MNSPMIDALTKHTREIALAGMGYALAKLAEDPGWLRRMDGTGTLADALGPDADSFMQVRGDFEVMDLADRLRVPR